MDFGIYKFLPEMTYIFPYVGAVDFAPFVVAGIVFFGFLFAFRILQEVVIARLRVLSKKTATDVDDVFIGAIGGIRFWVLILLALLISLKQFTLPTLVGSIVTGVALFAIVWQAIEVALCFIEYGAGRFLEKDEDGDGKVDPGSTTASHMVTLLARIVLWVVGGLFILSNLGIEVTSLIAGLGIGGIAVAFALQGILSDLFSSFSLYFDKPFKIGDYIVIGEHSGVVEKIGIKTTRIRTLQGEELVVSNAELTAIRVQNFKKMEKRRISAQFGITYDTSHEHVKQIPKMIKRMFESYSDADLDRVHFTTFGDSALLFDLVYYVHSPTYADYLDIQQTFNFELMDKFSELGIEFAYPTQTLYLKK